jgi:uncharacterized repeat protein (TIGR01451 family)
MVLWAGLCVAGAQTADLGLRMSTAPPRPSVGRPLTVTIDLTNAGPGTASSVVVSNLLPPGISLLSATSTLGTCVLAGDTVRCDLGTLAAGQAGSVTIAVRPDLSGGLTNLASVWAAEPDPNPADNTAVAAVVVLPPYISIYSTTVLEGDSGTTNAVFAVHLEAASGETISVEYRTLAGDQGGATPGLDFLSATGLMVFPPGMTSGSILVSVLGDLLNEANEGFSVQLFNPTNVLLAQRGYAWGTILNDDPLPVVSVDDVSDLEGDSGTTSAVFTVTLSTPSGRPVSVSCSTADGTARAGEDYVATNRTLVFPTGTTTQTVAVAVRGNTVFEGDEAFLLRLEKPLSNLSLGKATGVCTIVDDDAVPGRLDHFGWRVVPSPQLEDIDFQCVVTALDAFSNVVTSFPGPVQVAAFGSAGAVALLVTPTTLSNFTAGVWEGPLAVSQTNPAVILRADDGQEHIGASNPFDVVPLPRLSLQLPLEAREGDGGVTGQVSVVTLLPRAEDLRVTVSVTGTNRAAADAVLTIPAGATTAALEVAVRDDTWLNGSQSVVVRVSASNYIPAEASLMIHDNESTALNFVLPMSVQENSGVITGLLRAARAPDSDVTVTLTSSDTDAVRVPASPVLPAGLTEAPFSLAVLDNGRIDGVRFVSLAAEVRYWTNASAVLEVLDDETTNLVVALPASVFEGQGTLTEAGRVWLSGTWSTALTVNLTSSDSSKVSVPSSVFIPEGATTAVFNLVVPENTDRTGTRPVVVTAQAPGLGAGSNLVQVLDNDPADLVVEPITSPQTSGVPFQIRLHALDAAGAPATEFHGMADLSAWGSSLWPVSPAAVGPFTNGGWTGLISISGLEEMVRLGAGLAADLRLLTAPFLLKTPPVQVLGMHCQDLVYNPSNGLVYVSIPGSHWASISVLNPGDGRIQHWKDPYYYPDRLALSSDAQTLYATFPWDSGFGTFRTADGWECLQPFGGDWWISQNLPWQGDDFETLAGPGDLMVAARSLYHDFGGYGGKVIGYRGVGVYRQGLPLPDAFMQGAFTWLCYLCEPFPQPMRLTASADGQTVFCTWPGLYARLAVTTNGLSPIQVLTDRPVPAFGDSYGGEIIWDRGWLYRENGDVVDPDRLQLVGRFPTNGLLRPDSALNRVFLLGRDGPAGTWRLSAYDQGTFAWLAATNLSQVTGTPSSLIRCGPTTLAFRTSADQVFLLHGLLLPTDPATDLAVSFQVASTPIGLGTNTVFTLSATNQGTNAAAEVVLSARLPTALGPITVTAGNGACSASNGTLVCSWPTLAPGTACSLQFQMPTRVAGRFPCVGSVASRAQETDYSNNVSQVWLEVPCLGELRPTFSAMVATERETSLRFSTLGGECYRLERSATLAPGSWSVVLDFIHGTGETIQVSDPRPPDSPALFYRTTVRPDTF